MRRYLVFIALAICGFVAQAMAATAADTYPSRTIRVIVPYSAGGASDRLARLIADKLSERWKQPVIVENHPGAGTIIAYELASKAAPDGYTILQASDTLASNVGVYEKLPYDALADFAPVSRTAWLPLLIMGNNGFAPRSLQELVSAAKAKPGSISYASFGTGSSSHLAAELLRSLAGIDMVHVPYKGAPPAIVDLLNGTVQIFFSGLPPGLPFVKDGRATAIAVTGTTRSPLLPDVPTVAESGFPGYEAISWSGMLVPSGTPRPIVDKLNAAVREILADPDVTRRLVAQGFQPQTSTPEEFRQFIEREIVKWTEVARSANVKLN